MKLFNKITESFVAKGIITNEEQDICTYGLRQGTIMFLNVLTTIFIGLIFNVLWQCTVFLLAYIPLRPYAGGYHAKTQFRCYFLSIVMMVIIALLIKHIQWNEITIIIFTLVSSGIIFLLAPVGDSNKPLDEKETHVYRKKSRLILLFEIFIICVFIRLKYREASIAVMLSITVLAVALILGCGGNKK